MMIDPPSGWMYGFPKPIDLNDLGLGKSLSSWLVDNGYPEREADFAADHCRYWNEE